MNRIIITGNLAAKPEAYTTQSGITRSQFKVAVKRRVKNDQGNYDADFLTVIAWRQTAEYCNKYLDKGSKVAVEGAIQTRSYQAQDGSTRWVTEIIADHVEAMGSREDRPQDAPKPQRNEQQKMDYSGQFAEVDDPDLPF